MPKQYGQNETCTDVSQIHERIPGFRDESEIILADVFSICRDIIHITIQNKVACKSQRQSASRIAHELRKDNERFFVLFLSADEIVLHFVSPGIMTALFRSIRAINRVG